MNNLKLYNLIKEYAANCARFNNLLILKFNLNNRSELENINHFILPLRAAKLKIIEAKKSLVIDNNKELEYHIHGTGITFKFNGLNYSFDYFPVINEQYKMNFSISAIYDFINTISENIEESSFMGLINQLIDKGLITKIYGNGFSFYISDIELSENIVIE
ncbi:DUF6896 domain-containing protein [Chryseobacterium paridis]|uniref:DUF6896 domain-containing protein n=1 Tax=Chryseobacterium paridis TaxID=2800328 RepID=A0ABS1FY40_9FLAO|nr:hypothetical protein [Chryseobacterium paridis]MBK1897371.1 hypothetical protein [Chryseobacterium paridis]